MWLRDKRQRKNGVFSGFCNIILRGAHWRIQEKARRNAAYLTNNFRPVERANHEQQREQELLNYFVNQKDS